jgi:hypothetical protein
MPGDDINGVGKHASGGEDIHFRDILQYSVGLFTNQYTYNRRESLSHNVVVLALSSDFGEIHVLHLTTGNFSKRH